MGLLKNTGGSPSYRIAKILEYEVGTWGEILSEDEGNPRENSALRIKQSTYHIHCQSTWTQPTP